MSTPAINTAATHGLARVVTDLEHQVQQAPHNPGPPELNEVIQLAEQMRILTGDSLTPVLDRIWAAADAIDQAEVRIMSGGIQSDDLLDVAPDVITARVLASCHDRAAREALAHQNAWHFRDALARSAGTALADTADQVVAALRSDFDKQVKVIEAAAKLGITEHTEDAELLATGTDAQIAAYRALPPAAAALEQMAALRIQMTRVLRYGPPVHAMHLFVTGITTALDAEGLAHRYDGDTETVQYNASVNASTLTRVHVQRLGGRWLALATYPGKTKLHLNTAAEVTAQYEGLSN